MLSTKMFDYYLPQELIAQTPAEPRDHSRLLVYNRADKSTEHRHFFDITEYLHPGDALVINDTRVLPARLFGTTENGGAMQVLLLNRKDRDTWEVLVKPGKKARIGAKITFSQELACTVTDILDDGQRLVRFEYKGVFEEILDRLGQMPLPPYITERLEDKERYQTVYSRQVGSAAAPTAGLHFTKELLAQVRDMGVGIGYVTLHVGLGTFRPVKVDDVTQHHMHSEHYWVSQEAADLINEAKRTGHRVIAVGTTSCRTLESAYIPGKGLRECSDNTDIFIYPGYQWKCIDALITNFHLPESTLIMLVAAFAGYDHIMNAYHEAVKERYRFFSFGDAMFITNETKPQNTRH